jgi:HNH endonuclease|tara:strand:- start:239 stop:946 length:708 start_codon:yes stop_codon:yes gene_type:complete
VRITQSLKKQVFEEAGWKCEYCGVALNESNASIDHKMPRSKGGTDERENLAAACRQCNTQKADKIIEAISAPIAKQAAEAWIHAYINSPKVTSAVSFIVGVLGIVLALYFNEQATLKREAKLAEDLSFTNQINQLNETEENVKTLLSFIQQQRNQMVDNQNSLEELKEEKSKLQPLVSADKEIVETLFSAQEARAKASAKTERWIGFGLGIVASIVASIFIMIIQYFVKARRRDS